MLFYLFKVGVQLNKEIYNKEINWINFYFCFFSIDFWKWMLGVLGGIYLFECKKLLFYIVGLKDVYF